MPRLTWRTDLRCEACVDSIRPLFDADPAIESWSADVRSPEKRLTVEGDSVTSEHIEMLLSQTGYQLLGPAIASRGLPMTDGPDPTPSPATTVAKAETTATYSPLILILAYLLGGVLLLEWSLGGRLEPMRAMRHFMAGFFLIFSYFKLLDITAFAVAYRSYDIIAGRWPAYGYIYPFLELGLGVGLMADLFPVAVNVTTLIVMGVGTVGVVRTLLRGQKVRCACLGKVFQLPMSYVTLIEDLTMVIMSILMLMMS